ncbi:MAG: DUF1573 domain-containing protein [Rhodopirellula sp.]|nr:DUF1573 domain-containing protein [Rhodopirellula sp.]
MNKTASRAMVPFVAVLCPAVVWFSVRTAIHWPQPSANEMASPRGETRAHTGLALKNSRELAPKAVVDKSVHVFGVVDPTVDCRHTFTIRNEGEAPLELAKGATTCKCTTSEIPAAPVPPGMAASITVASKLQEEGDFSHAALILTNDSANPSIELRIRGSVRKRLASLPTAVVVPSVRRNNPIGGEFTVYSQVWDDFVVQGVKCSQEDSQWEMEPADAAVLKACDAKSGYQFRVTLPPKNKGGRFADWIELSVLSPEDVDKPRSMKVPITGSVPATIELAGKKFNGISGILDLGPLRPREGAREEMVLTVYDEHRNITVREIKTKPDFLSVKLNRCAAVESAGLYAVEIEIPANAPPCNWFTEKGEVSIVTDHPTVPEVNFKVAFAVLSR